MDEHINTDIGIYHIEALCDKKSNDGHKLYHVKCRYCEYESDMRLSDIKKPTICKHKNRVGSLLDFKPYWSSSRLRRIFNKMQDRCLNPNNQDYRWYGAKGINICEAWLNNPKTFEEWALNNGYSDDLTIDRIDSNGDYTPDNCRWIPHKENTRRAGKVNWINVNGVILTGRQWAERLQIGTNIINSAIRRHGIDKTKELIAAMLQDSPTTKQIKPLQSWFDIYGIQV